MALTSLNLTIDVSVIDPCTGLQLVDTTGEYNADTNPFGYNSPGGIDTQDVTELVIVLTENALGTTLTYTFELDSEDIIGATLSLGGATPVDIFDNLVSYVWPFTENNPFELTKDYGVSIPEFGDDVYKTEYTIAGNSGGDDFELTALSYLPVGCTSRCCIDKKWVNVDLNCSCDNNANVEILYLESLYNQFIYSTDAGSLTQALAALREMQKICGTDCGCGC